MKKKAPKLMSNELFAGKIPDKEVPAFILNHSLFSTKPIPYKKIFPSIGLVNFKDPIKFDKCLTDFKKEGNYIYNLVNCAYSIIWSGSNSCRAVADKIQYLEPKEFREKNKDKMLSLYSLADVMGNVASTLDVNSVELLEQSIQQENGKIVIRLSKDIPDPLNEKKIAHKKGEPLFRILNKFKDKCTEYGVPFVNIEQTQEFKIFSKENIPNKQYNVVFSSSDKEGAWDLLTISMRGIRSCQRFLGEYPNCLKGTILSKFIGVMYLTSGVAADPVDNSPSLGTKMMRRCIVRYVIDACEKKPVILLDKMYPELDKEVLKLFMQSLQSKTKIPVLYGPDLGNAAKHFYTPSEPLREVLLHRELSYQDTPLKTKDDLNLYLFEHNKLEIEKDIKAFKINLSIYLSRIFEAIYDGSYSVDPEIKKAVANIKMNNSFISVSEVFVENILKMYVPPTIDDSALLSSKEYYKKYLLNFIKYRNKTQGHCFPYLKTVLTTNTSKNFNEQTVLGFIFNETLKFVKLEIKKSSN